MFMVSSRREVVSCRLGLSCTSWPWKTTCHAFGGVVLAWVSSASRGEGIHHELNMLLNTFNSIPSNLARLRTAAEHHCAATLPQHQLPTSGTHPSCFPVVASRQRYGVLLPRELVQTFADIFTLLSSIPVLPLRVCLNLYL